MTVVGWILINIFTDIYQRWLHGDKRVSPKYSKDFQLQHTCAYMCMHVHVQHEHTCAYMCFSTS